MDVSEQLIAETKKWLERIEHERPKIVLVDKTKKDFLENIDAYIKDAKHFMDKGDFIRAFEAIIWAYSWLEIGERIGIIKK